MNWSEGAIEEVCAIWAIRKIPKPKSDVTKKAPSHILIKKIKRFANKIYTYPKPVFEIPEIMDSKQYDTMTYESVKMKFEFAEGVRPFVESWIIATEKVRHYSPISRPAKIIFN